MELTSCPRCESPQKFARRKRPINGVIEVFISCKICEWSMVVEYTTKDIESTIRTRNKLMTRRCVEEHDHGMPSGNTVDAINRQNERLSILRHELEKKLKDAGIREPAT